jgi:hypothetical protein
MPVDIPSFLDLGIELETEISKAYRGLAWLPAHPALTKRLRSLANDELNHANMLRIGKNYHKEMPDLFAGIKLNEEDVRAAIGEAQAIRDSSSAGQPLLNSLKRVLELEKAFERIHLASSVKINEPSLQKLFAGLAKADQDQVAIVQGMIRSLSQKAKP